MTDVAVTHDHDPELVSFAEQVGAEGPVTVVGGQTRWSLGGEVDPDARHVSAPTGIIDYVPEEMIVRVRAGTPVSELHGELATRGQWSALPERGGTVGGAIAVGQNDFRRPARGTVRDAVLQIRYVSAEGRIVSGGGPTVKNVSGFDLPRLFVGSLGTLGCIGEVTLRTNPVPARVSWFRADDVDPFEVNRLVLSPGAVLWDGTTTTVMLAGHDVAVDADLDRLTALCPWSPCDEPAAPSGHRWSLAPAQLASLDRNVTGAFVAEVGVGIVHAEHAQVHPPLSAGVRLVHERMKHEFDPTRRLNPGRVVGTR